MRLPAFVPIYYKRCIGRVKRKINIFLENFAATHVFAAQREGRTAKILAISGKLWYNHAWRANMDKWDIRFMELTEEVGSWASCLRRKVGAVIVRDKRVMTTGYNGAPAGIRSCIERGKCLRIERNIESGTRAELCYAAHAEQNALIQAAKYGVNIDGATLYCTHQPCVICAKMIINAGIKRVVYKEGYPDEFSMELFKEAGTKIEKFEN